MAFGWAGAGFGASQALRQQLQDQFTQQQVAAELENQLAERAFRQAQEQRLRDQMDMQRQQFEVQQQQNQQELSDKRNAQGLRMMAGDIADQYPNEPQKMVGTLIRAGIPIPSGMLAGQQAPEQYTLGPGQIRFDSTGKEVSRGATPATAAAAQESFTLSPGQRRFDASGKEIARGEPRPTPATGGAARTAQGQANLESQKFLQETAKRTISAIDDVLPDINMWTAGTVGRVLSNVPGTSASNVSAELAAVASNVAFNALQQMRAASRTGGALGQVSERELDLLSSVEGSIRQNQSPANLIAQLKKVRESMVRIQEAAGGGAGGGVGIKSITEIK